MTKFQYRFEEEEEEEENILADIEREGEVVDLVEEKETPAESPAEEKPVVEEPSQEGEHTPDEPDEDYKQKTSKRVQQLLKERKEERERREALEERLSKLEQRETPQEEVIPERWSELFSTGDPEQDQKAYQVWKTLNQEEKAAWKQEVLAELRAEESKETEEQEQFAAKYDELMDDLEAEGKEFDRNALMKFMTEIPGGLWTTDGHPNFALGLELMEARKPKSDLSARKKLAALKPQGSMPDKGYKTPDDLKGGWGAI